MGYLSISLLGTCCIARDSIYITGLASNKVRGLLAYLAVESERPHTRAALASLLWPESPEDAALASLRNALANLRHAIGDQDANPPILLITHNSIQFNRDSDCRVDVVEIARAASLRVMPGHFGADNEIGALSAALELYRGSFLKGFSLPENVEFEEWSSLQRERLGRIALEGLGRLTDHYEALGEYSLALDYAHRQVAIDPWLEESHRRIMRLLARCGQRAEALAQYETCRSVLEKELGVEPSEETQKLCAEIHAGNIGRTDHRGRWGPW